MMDPKKRKRLEAAGYRVCSVQEFLDLTDEEMAYVELKVALHRAVKQARLAAGWTQTELARRMGSSQSRVAKMEGGSPQVSVDLLLRALFALGKNTRDVAKIIA